MCFLRGQGVATFWRTGITSITLFYNFIPERIEGNMKLLEILDGKPAEKRWCCVYKWICLENGKICVGATNNFYRRMKSYKNGGATKKIKADMEIYGFEAFEVDILEFCEPDDLLDREAYWIKELNALDEEKGYNTCPYSSFTRGLKMSQETVDKISEASKKMWQNPDYWQAQHDRMVGAKNYFYGKHFNGELNPRWGKHCTEETKRRISEALKGHKSPYKAIPVKCVETGVVFESMTEAAKWLDRTLGAVGVVIDKPNRSCHGYHFVKVEKSDN